MKRRQVLAATSFTFLSSSLAGCFQNDVNGATNNESNGEDEPKMGDDNRPPISEDPRDVHLRNSHKKTHNLELEIIYDENIVHNKKYRIEYNSKRILEDFADEIGRYVITASYESGQKISDTWSVNNDSTAALVEIAENGELNLSLNPQL